MFHSVYRPFFRTFADTSMLVNTNAIVLRSVKYSDRGLIVHLLTQQGNRVGASVRLSASRRGGLRKQLFAPLNVLSVTFDNRPSKQLVAIREASLALSYASVHTDMVKMSIMMFLSEFLESATRGERDNPLLYSYISQSLEWIDAATGPVANFHLVMMIRLTRFIGFFPNTEDYRDNCFFDLRDGCYVLQMPLHHDVLLPAEARVIGTLMRLNYSNMHLFKMNREQRRRVIEVIEQYYRLHVPGFQHLKSVDVLSELF